MIRISGLVEQFNLTMYTLAALQDLPGQAARVLSSLARAELNLAYITEAGCQEGLASMTFCVRSEDAEAVDRTLRALDLEKTIKIRKKEYVSVIGIYGPHFREKPGVAAFFCSVLGKCHINILGLSSSISTISAIIEQKNHDTARNALLQVFELP